MQLPMIISPPIVRDEALNEFLWSTVWIFVFRLLRTNMNLNHFQVTINDWTKIFKTLLLK